MVLVAGEGVGDGFWGWEHGGGVAFEEEPVGGDGLESGADGGFAFVEEVAIEGEVGSELDELGSELGAAGVGVEEERGEGGFVLQELQERSPGFEAMDGEGALEFTRELELGAEAVELLGEVEGGLPAVEPALSDGGVGMFEQAFAQGVEPVWRAVRHLPGMETEGGGEMVGMLGAEFGYLGPVLFAGAVDQHVGDAGGSGLGENGSRVGELLEMVVGINHWSRRVRVAS